MPPPPAHCAASSLQTLPSARALAAAAASTSMRCIASASCSLHGGWQGSLSGHLEFFSTTKIRKLMTWEGRWNPETRSLRRHCSQHTAFIR